MFKQQLATLNFPDDYSLAMQNDRGETFTQAAEKLWPAASLIKLAIAAYGHSVWLQTPTLLDQPVTLKAADRVGGAGRLQYLSGRDYQLGDWLQLMLMDSDNTATNALLTTFGFAKVQAYVTANFPQVVLKRRLMTPGPENLISAAGCLRLLARCMAGQDAYWQLVQASLHHQATRYKLPYAALLGEFPQVRTFNKTGELAAYEHDAARFACGEHWCDCVVLTHCPAAHGAAIQLMQQVGRLISTSLCQAD